MAENLSITPLPGFGLATVMARRGVGAERIGAAIGLLPPEGPRVASGAAISLVGTGPGMWLAVAEVADADWAGTLAERLEGIAAVSDQSSGYALLRLSGRKARDLLQRGLPIDLHPDAFGPGSAATSVIAHIGVILWQTDDAPSYVVATFRSYGESFRHWIDTTRRTL